MDIPEVDFDHHSEDYKERSSEILAELRAACPIVHTRHYGGNYVVTSHQLVTEAGADFKMYSSKHILGDPSYQGANVPGTPYVFVPGELDPPQHTTYRRIFNPFFSRNTADEKASSVRRWSRAAIDTVIGDGSVDLVLDYANAVSALFTCDLLALPHENWRSWAEPAHDRASLRPGSPRYDQAAIDFSRMVDQTVQMALTRRDGDGDDLLSTVAKLQIGDEYLDDETLRSVCTSLIVGGFDTTASLVSNILWHLEHRPDLRLRLRNEPDLMESAIEEYLRFFTPAQGLGRTVTGPTTLGGWPLNERDRVFLSWAGANRDPAEFEDPDDVVFDRSSNHHVAFGFGVHRCVGRHFARMEAAIMVSEFLSRIPDYVIDHDRSERFPSIGIINGWVRMPATFEAGQPLQSERLP